MQRFKRSIALLLALLLALSAWGAAESFAYDAWTPLARGAKGEAVVTLQEQLIELGYLNGAADGDFGPATERALLAFQLAAGLEETGIADADTIEMLFSEEAPTATPTPQPTATIKPTATPTPAPKANSGSGIMVWIPRTGKKYHSNQKCSGMKNPSYVTIEEAERRGFTPCKKCY